MAGNKYKCGDYMITDFFLLLTQLERLLCACILFAAVIGCYKFVEYIWKKLD